ncbi:PH domain-containing protein [Zhouia sp. PK063]|uniref:PH domain-containing protein n=1 Tax=Zhouia sp. PK063 TaxID=3373602 RepID=UPI0037B3DC18
MNYYTATLDKTAKITTIGITILFATIIIFYAKWISEGQISFSITVFLILFIYALAFAYSPRKYYITSSSICIKRPLKNYTISIDKITLVTLISKEDLKHTIRTFGNGGLFGYYGKFSNNTLGDMLWFATNRNNAVLITTFSKKIVITPNKPEKFVSDYKTNMANS